MDKKAGNQALCVLIGVCVFVLGVFAVLMPFDNSWGGKVIYCWGHPHIGIEPEIENIKEHCKSEATKEVERERELVRDAQERDRDEDNGRK